VLWIALELPALPLQIAERAGVSGEPLVIAEGPAQRPLVACANEAAREAGIREGQAVAAARALATELRVLPRDAAAERKTLERLAAWAGQFTPMVSIESQGIALEVESSLRLFDGHARLTAAIRQGVRDLGFHALLGIAPTALAARVFARAEARGLAVRSCLALEQLAERLAELPLFLLDWPARRLAHLADLGVLRLRDALALPGDGVARRFGPDALLDLERLMGRVADPRRPYEPPPRFHGRLELPAEADGVEALLFPLRRMLVELEGCLRGRGCGVQRLALTLEHGRSQCTRLDLDFASPEREVDFILAIAREKLGRLVLPAATCALVLSADALLPYVPRSAAWLPGPRETAIDRERLFERLAARLGRDRVFGIALTDDHRPEKGFTTGDGNQGRSRNSAPRGKGREGFRNSDCVPDFRDNTGLSPVVAVVRPVWLLRRPHKLVGREGLPTYMGDLVLEAGPERIEAGWWDGEEVCRDYYVATNPMGEAFWIFREHRDLQAWYLHGVFS
jgi:protein ImuB